jgi:2-phosphosulfolactate phosphatase
MRKIDVCLSPDLLHLYDFSDRIVVVTDVLRATSCMVSALEHGIDHIVPVAELQEAQALALQGYLTAGERNGEQVEGFDLGNSPYSYIENDFSGRKLAMTTTNGTLALSKAAPIAKDVIAGAFINLSAVVGYLQDAQDSVLVLCAAWKGKVNLEDSLFAGALVSLLKESHTAECDAPLMASDLYEQHKDNLFEIVSKSSHFKRLQRLHVVNDAKFCLEPSLFSVVPKYINGRLIKA